MITKLRKIIAYTTSIIILLISLGLAKPNFNGEPTMSPSDFENKSTISTDINKN